MGAGERRERVRGGQKVQGGGDICIGMANSYRYMAEIKPLRLLPRWKMRPDSPAFHAEEFLVPKQRRKEPGFP